MNTIGIVGIAVFAAASAVNLAANFAGKHTAASAAKVLIVPGLFLFVVALRPLGTIWFPLGLALGFAGDALLIWNTKKPCFMGGLAAFLLGHVCYCIGMASAIGRYNLLAFIMSAMIFIAAAFFAYGSLKNDVGKEMKPPVVVYLFMLVCINFFAANVLVSRGGLFGALLLAGTVLFFISDYILARGQFRKPFSRQDFIVMATYIPAQLLIALFAVFGA